MRTVIVESHHRVLSSWAEYRKALARAPRLLTLDHHTDTSAPFRNRLKGHADFEQVQLQWLSDIDFKRPQTVDEAIQRLSHDEHITTAIRSDIISSALVVAHNAMDTDAAIYERHRIICHSVARSASSKFVTRKECDEVIESSFLDSAIMSFDQALSRKAEPLLREEPYILDIDLDYFNTRKSIAPVCAKTLRVLAQSAGLITVATEPEHVQSCSLEPELTSDYLLPRLLELLEAPGPRAC